MVSVGFEALYHQLCRDISPKQARDVVSVARYGSERNAARKRRKSQQAVSKNLRRAADRIHRRKGVRPDWSTLFRLYRRELADRSALVPAA